MWQFVIVNINTISRVTSLSLICQLIVRQPWWKWIDVSHKLPGIHDIKQYGIYCISAYKQNPIQTIYIAYAMAFLSLWPLPDPMPVSAWYPEEIQWSSLMDIRLLPQNMEIFDISFIQYYFILCFHEWTHWGQDKKDKVALQNEVSLLTTSLNKFAEIKVDVYWPEFKINLHLDIQLAISQQ